MGLQNVLIVSIVILTLFGASTTAQHDKCKNIDPAFILQCCKGALVKSTAIALRNSTIQCIMKMHKREDRVPVGSCDEYICAHECSGILNGLAYEDGAIRTDVLEEFAQNYVLPPWAEEIVDDIHNQCASEALVNAVDTPYVCNPSTYYYFGCLYRELNENCPESEIKDTEECTRKKSEL